MQINRLFQIIYILLNQKNVTAGKLAEYFEVSIRTIYRDVEILSQAGIPIYTERGKNGGLHLTENFILNKSLLSENEKTEILSGLHGLSETKATDDSALKKLAVFFGENRFDWVSIDFSDWSDTKQELFNTVKIGILERREITFDYYSAYGEMTTRRVRPIQLWFKGRTWYLKAYCLEKQDIRTFKLNRLKRILLHDDHFPHVEYTEKDEGANSKYQPILIHFTLKINSRMAYRVYDEFEEDEITKLDNGDFLVKVCYPLDDWVYGTILSYGEYAEVVEPQSLREEIAIRLKSMVSLYS